MGCWNKTCGLTNLHICAGTPVYVFVLEKNPDPSERCYSSAFWMPVLFHFESEYNDYGGGTNSSSDINFILQGIRKRLVEVEQGPNQYHDIAVKRDSFNEELFFESVQENRLKVQSYNNDVDVDFVMLRKDAVNEILENWEQEQYIGGTNPETAYRKFKYADVIAEIPDVINRLDSKLSANSNERLNSLTRSMFTMDGLPGLYEYQEKTLIQMYLQSGHRNSNLVNVAEIVVNLIDQNDYAQVAHVIENHVRGAFINNFFECTRKNWHPGGHEGSQSNDHSGYRVLCQAITTALDKEVKEQEEW